MAKIGGECTRMTDDFSLVDDFSDEDNSSGKSRTLVIVLVGLGLAMIACIAAIAIAVASLDLSGLSESASGSKGGGDSQLVVNNNSGVDVCYCGQTGNQRTSITIAFVGRQVAIHAP